MKCVVSLIRAAVLLTTVSALLEGCGTPIQTISPNPVPTAAGHVTTQVYTKVDLLPHKTENGDVSLFSSIPQIGGLLHEKGYIVASRSKWDNVAYIETVFTFATKSDGTVLPIFYQQLDKYADIKIPPATSTELQAQLGDLYNGGQGGVGVFDMDGGIIHEGAALTGSAGGGIVAGLIGGAVNTVTNALDSSKSTPKSQEAKRPLITKFPRDTVVLFGRIRQSVGVILGKPEEQRVIITAASDKPEIPAVLFDAALRKYVDVFANGYKK